MRRGRYSGFHVAQSVCPKYEQQAVADLTLLHLTDLHFGWDRDTVQAAERQLVLDRLIDSLAALRDDWRPDVVCVGGDVGWKGNA